MENYILSNLECEVLVAEYENIERLAVKLDDLKVSNNYILLNKLREQMEKKGVDDAYSWFVLVLTGRDDFTILTVEHAKQLLYVANACK